MAKAFEAYASDELTLVMHERVRSIAAVFRKRFFTDYDAAGK
jgi:hypothetical protein